MQGKGKINGKNVVIDDPEELQALDESNTGWVKKWKQVTRKKVKNKVKSK